MEAMDVDGFLSSFDLESNSGSDRMLDSIADSFDADGFNFDNDAINRILEDDALFQSVDDPHLGAGLEPEPGEQFMGDGRMESLGGGPGGTEECTCKTCGKTFNSVWYLKQHAVKHSSDRPFKCKHCGKTYRFRSNLYQHKCALRPSGEGVEIIQTTPTPTRQRQRNPAAAGESPNGAPKRRRNNGRKSANGNGSCSNGASPGAEFAASLAPGNPHGNPNPYPQVPNNPGPNNPGSKGGATSKGKPYRPTQEAIDAFILEHKEELHRCGKCKQYFPSREYLQSHLASHQWDTKVKCLHCSEAFDDDETYAAHKTSHVPQSVHVCRNCKGRFINRLALRKHNAKCTIPSLAQSNPWAKVMGPPPMPKPPPQAQTSPQDPQDAQDASSSSFFNLEGDPNAPSPQLDASMFGGGGTQGQNGVAGGSSAHAQGLQDPQGVSTSAANHDDVENNAPGSSSSSSGLGPRLTQSGATPTNITQASSLAETPKFTGPDHQPIATSTPNLHLHRAHSSPNGTLGHAANGPFVPSAFESPTFFQPPPVAASLVGSYDLSTHNGIGHRLVTGPTSRFADSFGERPPSIPSYALGSPSGRWTPPELDDWPFWGPEEPTGGPLSTPRFYQGPMIANPKTAALASGGPLAAYDPLLMIGSTNDEAWMPWSASPPPLLEENRATAVNPVPFPFDPATAPATNFVQRQVFGANGDGTYVWEPQSASEGRMWDAVMAVCAKVLDGHSNSQPECACQKDWHLHGAEGQTFTCMQCGAQFTKISTLQAHFINDHLRRELQPAPDARIELQRNCATAPPILQRNFDGTENGFGAKKTEKERAPRNRKRKEKSEMELGVAADGSAVFCPPRKRRHSEKFGGAGNSQRKS